MRLADFIEASSKPILVEWVAFAKSCGPAARMMDETALRDHVSGMLEAIVADLRTSQTATEQVEKSKGNSDSSTSEPDTAAEVHGSDRAWSGFTIGEMVSEYRALRASVVRLWTHANGVLSGVDLADLVRFNEAIDQALAESVTRYAADLDRSKEMFLAILGHDLRTPLGAVIMSSQFMLESGELREPNLTLTSRIDHSARRMNQMVGDLLDFTRSQLGSGLPISRANIDMAKVLRHSVDEVEAAYPERTFDFQSSGDTQGEWDAARMSQVFANLLGNAVEHGLSGSTISVTLQGRDKEIRIRVHNLGNVIPPSGIYGIFSPFKRLQSPDTATHPTSGLGLGLFIADRIVQAHGGSIEVRSAADAGTSFTVVLPRDPTSLPAPSQSTSRTDRRAP